MAKFVTVKYSELSNTEGSSLVTLGLQSASRSKVVLADIDSGDQLIFQGRNLKMDDGRIDSGIITRLVFATEQGEAIRTFSGFQMSADLVIGTTLIDFAVSMIANVRLKNSRYIGTNDTDDITAFKGNDVLLGRDGDDILSGAAGNDRMTGGAGSDTFTFNDGFKRDIITDFDADGGPGAQDFIDAVFADATITQDGADAVLDFGDGDVLTLRNVDAAQISVADFV